MRLLIVVTVSVALATAEMFERTQIYQYHGPPAPLSSDGMVMDTPEVAKARAAHLAMHAEAMERLRRAQNNYEVRETENVDMMPAMEAPMMRPMPKRERQRSSAPLGSDGRVVDTPEVAEAKAAHLEAHARATSRSFYLYEAPRRNLVYLTPFRLTYTRVAPLGYSGPPAPLGPDGRVVDTPEVVKAREAHLKAHARAMALVTNDENYV